VAFLLDLSTVDRKRRIKNLKMMSSRNKLTKHWWRLYWKMESSLWDFAGQFIYPNTHNTHTFFLLLCVVTWLFGMLEWVLSMQVWIFGCTAFNLKLQIVLFCYLVHVRPMIVRKLKLIKSLYLLKKRDCMKTLSRAYNPPKLLLLWVKNMSN